MVLADSSILRIKSTSYYVCCSVFLRCPFTLSGHHMMLGCVFYSYSNSIPLSFSSSDCRISEENGTVIWWSQICMQWPFLWWSRPLIKSFHWICNVFVDSFRSLLLWIFTELDGYAMFQSKFVELCVLTFNTINFSISFLSFGLLLRLGCSLV